MWPPAFRDGNVSEESNGESIQEEAVVQIGAKNYLETIQVQYISLHYSTLHSITGETTRRPELLPVCPAVELQGGQQLGCLLWRHGEGWLWSPGTWWDMCQHLA